MIGDIISLVLTLVGAVCVILLTYYASKWYARRMGPLAKGSHIKVIDRQMVSKSGALLIVEIEGTQYVVGATEQTVQIMLKLDTPIDYQPTPESQVGNFKSLLKTIIKKDGNHEQHL